MKRTIGWGILLFVACTSFAEVKIKSPDGSVSALVEVDVLGRLSYRVFLDDQEVLPLSPLGITVDARDLGKGVHLGKAKTRRFKERYAVQGLHDTALNHYREAIIPLLCNDCDGEAAVLEVRAFNDGVAYRYRVPGVGQRKVAGEMSAWVLPEDATVWFQQGIANHESVYEEALVKDLKKKTPMGVPVTVRLANHLGYLMLTEANLNRYSDMCLRVAGEGTLASYFHADKDGWNLVGEVLSPWRVTLVARDLNTLANSDIVKNLCPAPEEWLAKADFYKPGRAIWHWWSTPDPLLKEQKMWYDSARALGFEYYLIDEGWKRWSDGDKDEWACLREQVAYGKSIGVETAIWVHSKEVSNDATRHAYMQRTKDCGVTGIKIDFMPPASSEWVQWYEDTLREAAKIGLFVDFHGATKPTGRERTWPHDLTREAVRGHEWHISRYKRMQPPSYDTILPFCRNVQGRADYTPTVFNPAELNGFTWARELAQPVIFHSPFLCYADHPKWYLENPAVKTFSAIPAVWNETRVLPGSEIGKVVAMAKRDKEDWFVGVINADQPQTLKISCDFLGRGSYRMTTYADQADRDDAYVRETRLVTRKEQLTLAIRKNGGFVAHFVKE